MATMVDIAELNAGEATICGVPGPYLPAELA
jgi:hypothetical protein